MEVFSLLKLKKPRGDAITQSASARTTTISTSALHLSSDAIHDGGGASFDDGPFFDLEFSAGEESTPSEFKMSVSSPRHRLSSSSSPFLSEEILFNGRLFRLESSSSFSASEPNAMPQFPDSTPKSTTNLRVFMFRSRSTSRASPPMRKLPKDVILRCISKIKPFYVKVSNLSFSGPSKNRFAAKQSHVQAAVPARRLRKCRSASSAVTSVVSPLIVAPRRDDSLLQQEDGIQSAIAHCKRSFHADKGFGGADLPMVRSMSDPGGERCAVQGRGGGSTADDFSVC